MPNFLVMDNTTGAGGVTCAAFLYANGSPTQIGDTFGTDQGPSNPANFAAGRSSLIQWDGDLYGLANDGVYKKDDPATMTGPWTQVMTWVSASLSEQAIGLFAIGNELVALGGLNTASNNILNWARTSDGASWSQGAGAVVVGTTGIVDVIVFHDVVHVVVKQFGTTYVLTWDPSTGLFAQKTAAWNASSSPHSMCVFEDRLFAIAKHNSTDYGLYEYTGSWVLLGSSFRGTPNHQVGASNYEVGKWALFTDGTTMTAVVAGAPGAGGFGWQAFEWDIALARTDVSVAGCIPVGLLHTDRGGSYAGGANIYNERMLPVYDLNTAVGTTDIYLFYAVNGTIGTSWTVYKWNGNASVMTVVDSGGGNAFHSLPTGLAFGERIFTAGELDIRITAREGFPGGEKNSFIVNGGGTGRKIKMHHLLKGTPPLLPCTFLAGTVTGGSATLNVGAKQIENVDADGVTVYSVVWAVGSDGLSTADRVIRAPEALV